MYIQYSVIAKNPNTNTMSIYARGLCKSEARHTAKWLEEQFPCTTIVVRTDLLDEIIPELTNIYKAVK